ncbi:MAG: phosphotransferase [Erysipelotrichales bacterium]|nr:phosphotransferase [Erysipelotrichales bacterium]
MNIDFIKSHNIVSTIPLLKGWSRDKKYILEDTNGTKYLLRISDKSLYEQKHKQFELLKKIESLDIYCSRPIEFGVLEDESVYMILSYLEGIDGIEAIKTMSDKEAYELGVEAGKILKKLHKIDIPMQEYTWWDRYQRKMGRKIDALLNCEYRIPMQEEIIEFYKDNCYLMENRPLLFTHGDYHLGNMIVKDGKVGIIDFDKNGISDPYDDLKPFCWNVMESEYFETGLINGYFDNEIPRDFFKILKFYTAESLISHLPWATTFGEAEIKTAKKVADYQMKWYDNFKLDIPIWYKGIIK